MMEDLKVEGNGKDKGSKVEQVQSGWQVTPNGIMTVTVTLADVPVAIYTLDKAKRHIHKLIEYGEEKQRREREALAGVGSQAKQNQGFFKKHFC